MKILFAEENERPRPSAFQTVLTWEKLQIDLETCKVIYDKAPVHLTPKEYALLALFLRNPRKIFSRSALLRNVWKADECPGEQAVTAQIKGLRQKLKAAGMTADCLETVYGLGYYLNSEPANGLEQSKDIYLSSPQQAQEDVEAAIEKVWQKLKATFSTKFALLDQLCMQAIALHRESALHPASGVVTLDPELLQTAILEVHRLAGNLGTFGLPEGSELAQNIEQLLRANTLLNQHEAQQLCDWVAALKQVVTQQRNVQTLRSSQSQRQAYQPSSADAMIQSQDYAVSLSP